MRPLPMDLPAPAGPSDPQPCFLTGPATDQGEDLVNGQANRFEPIDRLDDIAGQEVRFHRGRSP